LLQPRPSRDRSLRKSSHSHLPPTIIHTQNRPSSFTALQVCPLWVAVLELRINGLGVRGWIGSTMERIVFMGTPRFGELVLGALVGHYEIVAVATQPDRKAGRGRRIRVPRVKALALEHGVRVLQPKRVGDPSVIEQLRGLEPAVIAVAAFGQILPPTVLSIPEYGSVNVHASLLPRHRGAAPIPATILAGDDQAGVTIMLMDEGLDTGPMLCQARIEVGPQDTTASLTERLGCLGGQLLLDTLPRWIAGDIAPRAQDDQQATYAGQLRRKDGRIDWTESAEQIARRIRAYHPWPGSSTIWNGMPLKVLRARPLAAETAGGAAGRVMLFDSAVTVATGQGLLALEELQLAGRRRLLAHEFIRGQRGFIGSVLQ
jgi:methionyl-tRNA formyltransferase